MPTPPVAPRRPHVWHRSTGDVPDDYAWLADRNDPETLAYLSAENAHADDWFAQRHNVVNELFQEIKSRVQEDDDAVPVRRGRWWYTSRTATGKAYAVHTRGRSRDTATEIVLLDENIEAEGHDYFSLNIFDVSNNDSVLAWSSDVDGSERFTIRFRDLRTGQDLVDTITDSTYGGSAWSADDRHFFYVVPDEAMRPWRVMRHDMGTPPEADVCVFEDVDERFFVSVDLTRSRRWIVIESASKTSAEAWIIDAHRPTDPARVIRPRQDDVEYSIDHWGDSFVVLHNIDAVDFRIDRASEDTPGTWQPFIDHRPSARIVQFDCFRDFGVMQRWVDGQQQLTFVSHDGAESPIHVSDEPHEIEIDANPEWETDIIRISFQGLSVPPTVANIARADGGLTVLKQMPTPNVVLADYVAHREWATAPDGARVPVDIVRHKKTPLDGTAPCLLYAYGSYEASMAPWFSVARLSLLDRGWVWALAHPRGGGEMGRQWYLDGKLLNKRNTFTDTLACAHHLGGSVVDPTSMVVRGGSAGGLLVGACITIEPHTFAGAVAEVPFVDIISTMSDPTLPLTVTEWEEWGDPRTEPYASYMSSYSPYDNTGNVKYPNLYVTAGLNDPRVSYHEPAKWVARLRAVSPQTTVIFKCEMGAGHGGPSGRYDRWRDEAKTLVFVMSAVSR